MTAEAILDNDQLIATRYLDAAPALVWDVFTTPEHLAAFWGGQHAIVPSHSVRVDLRVGGTFELETQGAAGDGNHLSFQYDIIDPPRLLSFVESRTGLTTEIRFRPTGDGTTVVIHQRRLPPELQSEQARVGLMGVLDQLNVVVQELTIKQRKNV